MSHTCPFVSSVHISSSTEIHLKCHIHTLIWKKISCLYTLRDWISWQTEFKILRGDHFCLPILSPCPNPSEEKTETREMCSPVISNYKTVWCYWFSSMIWGNRPLNERLQVEAVKQTIFYSVLGTLPGTKSLINKFLLNGSIQSVHQWTLSFQGPKVHTVSRNWMQIFIPKE